VNLKGNIRDHFRDAPGVVARLLLQAYEGDPKKVQRAARLARRVLEMLEFDLESTSVDCFVDASGTGQYSHVKKMILEGVDVDGKHSRLGYTALHAACDFGHLKIVKLLMDHGADMYTTRKSDENIPLHCAAETGQLSVVKYLVIDRMCDKAWKNKYGMIPFEYASEGHYEDIMKILREPPKQILQLQGDTVGAREAHLTWEVPEDNGVDIERYELTITEGKCAIRTIVVDGLVFGESPLRLKRQESQALRLQMKMEDESKIEDESKRTVDSKTEEEPPVKIAFCNVESLIPSTKYRVSIRAFSMAGAGTESQDYCFTTLPAVPDAPGCATLKAGGATSDSIDVTWRSPACNNGKVVKTYELQYRKLGESEWTTHANDILGSVTKYENTESGNRIVEREFEILVHTLDGLESASKYSVRIRGENYVGYGDYSEYNRHVLSTRPPALPKHIGSKSITIDWEESVNHASTPSIVCWELQRTIASCSEYNWRNAEWILISTTIPGNKYDFSVRDLLPATMYFFRVRPIFKDGSDSPTWDTCAVSTGIVTQMAPPDAPCAPYVKDVNNFNEDSADIRHDSIRVSWDEPRDNGHPVTRYCIRYTAHSLNTWHEYGEMNPSGMEYTLCEMIPRLECCQNYKFAVRAMNENGWSPFSSPSEWIETRPASPPGVPRKIQATDEMLTIEWDSANASCSQVQYKEVDGISWTDAPYTTEQNEITVTDLQPVTQYVFRVRIKKNNGSWSNYGNPGGPFKTQRRF